MKHYLDGSTGSRVKVCFEGGSRRVQRHQAAGKLERAASLP